MAMAHMLIATDNVGLYQVFAAELEGDRHEVHWAVNGKEAFDMLVESMPDLAFLDVHLPLFSGLGLSKLIRAEPAIPPEFPIVLLSDDPIDPHVVEKTRVSAVFPKQHLAQDLRELICRLLGPQAAA